MKIKSILTCLAISLLISSCHVYKEYDKNSFPSYSWKSGQKILFTPTIEDINKTYKLTLGIRHLYGFQLSSLRVTIAIVSPSGKETSKDYTLAIKNAANEYVGKCAGDLCDLEAIVDENIKFEEAGQYSYTITHNVQTDEITGVMEFGLIIDEQN